MYTGIETDNGNPEMGTPTPISKTPTVLPSWGEMFSGAAAHVPSDQHHHHHHREQEQQDDEEEDKDCNFRSIHLSRNPQLCLAIYIAMAHAGLAFSLALLYGLTRLLEEYWRPIQWAILCSMPLREVQRALVQFWTRPLNLGLFETLVAVPVAVFSATTGSIVDSQAAFLRLLRNRQVSGNEKIGFSKLMQWLVAFGLFVFAYERIGASSVPVFALMGLIANAAGWSTGSRAGNGNLASAFSAALSIRLTKIASKQSAWGKFSRNLTSGVLNRLKTMVGIGLISAMIVGSVAGFVFFTYKIGIEGKDAVISLKTHLQERNYAEETGLKQWMDENDVPQLIDTYTAKFYETLSQQIDSLALHYNVTEIVDMFKHYLMTPVHSAAPAVPLPPFSRKLHNLRLKVHNREWKTIYRELGGIFREFLSLIAREDLLEKIKGFALQSVHVSKRVFASSTMVLAASAKLLFSIAVSIVSGAAGLLNFISQLMVFFWLLYYLITSESGGVMDHVLGLIPISDSTRVRCAQVLAHAVSSVLLATVKVAFFQGCLTYLLFRFYRIHFLYMSTFLAFMSAMLPITPIWLSSIPAAAQLAMEARYVQAVVLAATHLILMDYGVSAIQEEIPGQSAYLTGLSILGGMALCPSALEGAIMGPLLMTVMFALKNLYAEFVLTSAKETDRHIRMFLLFYEGVMDPEDKI